MFKLLRKDGSARLGRMETVHGTIQTPVFMNIGTAAAIKGGVSTLDLAAAGCQVQLSNAYHLHLRPGDETVKVLGGLHRFMNWDRPILTDSGGFQVFSLASLRKIKEEGVYFASHIDGRPIFMGPEESIRIQSNLGSTIAMAFDECVANPAEHDYAAKSIARTTRWLIRSKTELERLNTLPDTVNKSQLLFGINQGATFKDLRTQHMRQITELDLSGYAIGGLAVGEPAEVMYDIIETVEPLIPIDKPRYLMGVGTPQNIAEAVYRGVDFFDCVIPSRNARHGTLYTQTGTLRMLNQRHARDDSPVDSSCNCECCARYSRAYLHHLFKAKEMLAMRLSVIHNLTYYNRLMSDIRAAITENRFADFRKDFLEIN